jgi:hypothetical protein
VCPVKIKSKTLPKDHTSEKILTNLKEEISGADHLSVLPEICSSLEGLSISFLRN